MVTITVPVDTLIHTNAHPYCDDRTCPCQVDGYQLALRSVRSSGYGFDIVIRETPRARGLHIEIEMEGIHLTRKQHRELARQLAIWKWGVKEGAPSL